MDAFPLLIRTTFLFVLFSDLKVIWRVFKKNGIIFTNQVSLCLLKSFLQEIPLSTFHSGDVQTCCFWDRPGIQRFLTTAKNDEPSICYCHERTKAGSAVLAGKSKQRCEGEKRCLKGRQARLSCFEICNSSVTLTSTSRLAPACRNQCFRIQ